MAKEENFLLVNQSTTYLFRSLCERLADSFPDADVVLLSGALEAAPEEQLNFRWIRSIELIRHSALGRIWTWGLFSLHFLGLVLFRRFDVTLLTTNPPLCPWLMGLVNRFIKRPYILIEYDIYPDVLARMGGLKEDSMLYRLLRAASARSMASAAKVVTLGQDMARHLEAHCDAFQPDIELIPNWADTRVYKPVAKEENPFALTHGLSGKFVVMYSGAFGATHDMDSILVVADALRELQDLEIVLIGKGTRYPEIKAAIAQRALPNVTLLEWQPLEMVPFSLAAADCHIVTLDAPYAGISFPSKFYTSIAVGAAILALAPKESDLWQTVERDGVGLGVAPGNVPAMAEAIRTLYQDRAATRTMQQRSRELSESTYDEIQCTERYAELVRQTMIAG